MIFLEFVSTYPEFFRDYAYYVRQLIDSYDTSVIIVDINYDNQDRICGQFLKLSSAHNLLLAVQLMESSYSKSKSSIFETP
jgi:hypothetical protein